MIRRFFWFALGAGVAIFVFVKIRDSLRKATPQAVGQRVADQAAGVGRVGARLHRPGPSCHGRARGGDSATELGLPE